MKRTLYQGTHVGLQNKFPPSTSGVESIISDGRLHMQQRKRNRLYQQLGEQVGQLAFAVLLLVLGLPQVVWRTFMSLW